MPTTSPELAPKTQTDQALEPATTPAHSPYRISRLGAAALYCAVLALGLSVFFAARIYLGVHSHGAIETTTAQWVGGLLGIPFALAGLALAAGARSAIGRSEGTLLSPGLALGSALVAVAAAAVYVAAVPVLMFISV
jgi:hypothetical protein